jgi:HK97 gp10 family phage protein
MAEATMQLKGVEELKKLLETYPEKVALTAQKRGLTRGAARLRTYFRAAAPKKTGTLRKSISYRTVKGSKGSKVIVGLMTRQYYKVLEQGRKPYKRLGRPVAGSPPMRDIQFSSVWYSQREGIAQLIIDEARRAVYQEAANIHSKTLNIARRKV